MKIGIVGGGINGTFLAWKLSKEHEVTLFEKKKTIGKDVCSGLVSERLWDYIPKSQKLIQNTISQAVLHFPKKDVKFNFYPKMLVLNRKSLDGYIASLAEKNGAKILLNTEVKKIYHVKGKRPQISVKGKLYEFDYLIGSDGYFSVVRKSIGIKAPKYRLGIYTYVNKKSTSDKVDIYPLDDGFLWVIPRKKNIEYGILANPSIARKRFDSFCKKKKVKPTKIYSYVVPRGLIHAEMGRIALCGDVIGLTKPWSGGGILWSLTADEILINSFPDFKKYNEKLKDYFEPKIFFSKLIEKTGRFVGNNTPRLAPKELYFDGDWIF
ncbi:MAG: FAD-dependent monooxygenase [Candidatus Aenigmatarchaeota archaeon]